MMCHKKYLDCEEGTRLYLMDEAYQYRTKSGEEKWLASVTVESNKDHFREPTAVEEIYHIYQKL